MGQIKRHWRAWSLAACILVCALAVAVYGQTVVQQSGPIIVQLNPAGQATTSQSGWTQTATATAATITLTQPASSGKTQFITGFEVTGSGATAASVITVTLASGGTTIGNYNITVPAGVTTTVTPLVVSFNPPLVGLSPGQTVVLTVPSFGAGNTNAAATLHGFYQ